MAPWVRAMLSLYNFRLDYIRNMLEGNKVALPGPALKFYGPAGRP